MKKMLPTYSCIRIFSFKIPWSLLKLRRNFPREYHTIIAVHLWIKIWSNDKVALIVAYTFRPLKRNHFTGVVAEPLKVVLKTQQSVCDHRETIIYYFIYSGVRKVFCKIIQQNYFKETWFVLWYRSVSCQEIIVMCYTKYLNKTNYDILQNISENHFRCKIIQKVFIRIKMVF